MADEDSCLICTEAINVRPHSLLMKCGHRWCRECINRGFDLACREEQSFPPRCCDRITLQDALPFLRPDLVDRFRQREQELGTNDRLYCHRPSCQQILLRTVKTVHCFACGSITCAECKGEGHEGLCTNRDDEGFKAAVSAAGFQQCRRCKRMVEKSGGCNHIT